MHPEPRIALRPAPCYVLAMYSVASSLFGVWWTTTVTLGGVAAARVTRNDAYALSAERLWARGLLGAWGVRLEVEGGETLRPDRSYVVMPNHQSHVDIPVLFAALPAVPSFLAKKELARVPVLGAALRAGRHVLVERGDRESSRQALDEAARQVADGRTVVVFPEGTRSTDGSLGDLKRGGFLIAKRARVPIVPIRIDGTARVLPVGARTPSPGRVRVRIGEPIGAEQVGRLPTRQLVERVREALGELAEAATSAADGVGDRISHVRVAAG